MNDAAELNDNIGSRAQAVDGPNQGDKDGNLDKDPNHLDPS